MSRAGWSSAEVEVIPGNSRVDGRCNFCNGDGEVWIIRGHSLSFRLCARCAAVVVRGVLGRGRK